MFEKLKSKLRGRKSKKDATKRSSTCEQKNVKEAPTAISPSKPSENVDNSVEKPTALAPVTAQPDVQTPLPQPAAPVKDLWQDALKQLPPVKQERLKSMGFDKLSSGSVETDIDDLVNIVNDKQKQCEKKFWRVSVGDNDIVLRNYTTKIVGWLQKAGDIAIQFAPPQASMPWAVLKKVMQVAVIEDEQMAALLGTTEKLVRIISRGQVYEQVYLVNAPGSTEDKLSKSLEGALVRIYSTSLDLLADSGDLFSKNTAHRTLEALINPGHVSSGLSALSQQEDELLRDVQACETRRSAAADDRMIGMLDALNAPLTRVDENVQTILEEMNNNSRLELLEWISSTPFGEHHGNVKENRTPGTGEWLLQDKSFHEWEQSKSSGIFWLQGLPGTGKTYLTSRVVDLFQGILSDPPMNEGLAFFYCDKNEQGRGQAQSIFQSYVRQLSTTASNPESIRTELKKTCEKTKEAGSTLRFEACKKQILESLNVYPKTILLLDAFDECEPESRDQLIEALNSLISETKSTVKVFISSRPDPDIQALLEGSTSVGIQASDNQLDIQKFLEVELERLAKKTAFIGRLKSKIVEKLLERCQGMFQWASLQVHQIVRCKTETSVWKRLENLPDDLQNAYDEVWNEIDNLEEPDRTLAQRAMLWVMAAYRPMDSETLISAIRVGLKDDEPFLADEIDEQGLLSLCNNFLVIDSKLKVWRFSHLSVTEYLQAKHQWTPAYAHTYAATASLSFFINIYKDENPSTVAEDLGYDSDYCDPEDKPVGPWEIHDTTNPFHLYIRHHWVIHVHGSQSSEESTVASLLKAFLGAPEESSVQFRRWSRQVFKDCTQFKPCIDKSGWDTSGYDSTFFDKYESVYAYGGDYRWASELDPEDMAIFAMCRFAFDTLLWDWWENKEIDISRTNDRGHNLLMIAAIGGSVPICKSLIAKGIDVNTQFETRDYGNALVAAAHHGQTNALRCLVEAGADVNTPVREGWFGNPLVAAIDQVHVETARYLVQEARADVNAPPLEHEIFGNAIGRAALTGDSELIKCLVDAGADINQPTRHCDFSRVLEGIVQKGGLQTLKYAVQAGADVNIPLEGGSVCGHILETAAKARKIEFIEYLLHEAHVDVNIRPHHGNYGSPLAAATAFDSWSDEPRIDPVEYLIHAGADPNLLLHTGDYGSALIVASTGELKNIERLVDAGADVNLAPSQGTFGSPLAAAAFCYGQVDIINYLVQKGANVNLPLQGGEYGSALATAAARGQFENVKALVEAGADVNLQLPGGNYGSALAAASTAMDGSLEMIDYLLEKGADVNLPHQVGKYGSALAAAARENDIDITERLIKAGAEVNKPLEAGDFGSALAAAVCGKRLDVIKLLVTAGADVNMALEGKTCATALTAGVAHPPYEGNDIVEFLIEAGADVNQANATARYGSALIAAAYLGHKDVAERLIKVGADVSLSVDSASFKTALEASQAPISEADVERIRDYWDEEEFIAEETESLKEKRAAVGELLRVHGATA